MEAHINKIDSASENSNKEKILNRIKDIRQGRMPQTNEGSETVRALPNPFKTASPPPTRFANLAETHRKSLEKSEEQPTIQQQAAVPQPKPTTQKPAAQSITVVDQAKKTLQQQGRTGLNLGEMVTVPGQGDLKAGHVGFFFAPLPSQEQPGSTSELSKMYDTLLNEASRRRCDSLI